MASSLKAIIVTALLGFLAVLCPVTVQAQSLTGWNLVWSDEFNGTSLDTTKWGLELNEGDPGSAVFTGRPQNLFVSNGSLVLQAQKENYNGKQYISLGLYDGPGRRVVSLVDAYQPAGSHSLDLASSRVRPGLYICAFESQAKRELKRIVLK